MNRVGEAMKQLLGIMWDLFWTVLIGTLTAGMIVGILLFVEWLAHAS